MDTLKVQIVDTNQFYSSINFYTLIIACISLLISGWALYLQYRRGHIIVPPIRSFGAVFLLNTIGRKHKINAREISGIRTVVPILIYNTGNKKWTPKTEQCVSVNSACPMKWETYFYRA